MRRISSRFESSFYNYTKEDIRKNFESYFLTLFQKCFWHAMSSDGNSAKWKIKRRAYTTGISQTKEEIHSLLEVVKYCSLFIDNLSVIAKHLIELSKMLLFNGTLVPMKVSIISHKQFVCVFTGPVLFSCWITFHSRRCFISYLCCDGTSIKRKEFNRLRMSYGRSRQQCATTKSTKANLMRSSTVW